MARLCVAGGSAIGMQARVHLPVNLAWLAVLVPLLYLISQHQPLPCLRPPLPPLPHLCRLHRLPWSLHLFFHLQNKNSSRNALVFFVHAEQAVKSQGSYKTNQVMQALYMYRRLLPQSSIRNHSFSTDLHYPCPSRWPSHLRCLTYPDLALTRALYQIHFLSPLQLAWPGRQHSMFGSGKTAQALQRQ